MGWLFFVSQTSGNYGWRGSSRYSEKIAALRKNPLPYLTDLHELAVVESNVKQAYRGRRTSSLGNAHRGMKNG
jgi:hypothetical protein